MGTSKEIHFEDLRGLDLSYMFWWRVSRRKTSPHHSFKNMFSLTVPFSMRINTTGFQSPYIKINWFGGYLWHFKYDFRTLMAPLIPIHSFISLKLFVRPSAGVDFSWHHVRAALLCGKMFPYQHWMSCLYDLKRLVGKSKILEYIHQI